MLLWLINDWLIDLKFDIPYIFLGTIRTWPPKKIFWKGGVVRVTWLLSVLILMHLTQIHIIFTTLPLFNSHSGGMPCDIDIIYALLESTFNGLQFCRGQYGSIFIRLAAVGDQMCEIRQNSERIWHYSSSRSSKVIDLGVNRKRIYNFLLVINSNFGRISYCFRDIDV